VGGLPENPTLSTKKGKYGGGEFKNNSRGGFSGWTRASFAGTGVGAELTSFAAKIGSSFGVQQPPTHNVNFTLIFYFTVSTILKNSLALNVYR
jgi:hypothetical protein